MKEIYGYLFCMVLVIGLFVFIGVVDYFEDLQQKPFLYTSSHTIAACNNNYCIDLLIHCNSSGHITNIKPITDLIYMGSEWIDPREEIKWC